MVRARVEWSRMCEREIVNETGSETGGRAVTVTGGQGDGGRDNGKGDKIQKNRKVKGRARRAVPS
jgi:hypothetical protein